MKPILNKEMVLEFITEQMKKDNETPTTADNIGEKLGRALLIKDLLALVSTTI